MSRKTEDKAIEILTNPKFHKELIFKKPTEKNSGYDLIMTDNKGETLIELKATEKEYKSSKDIFEGLVFNSKKEKDLFEKGETKVLRVFLGGETIRMFLFGEADIDGKKLVVEDRYVFRGKSNNFKPLELK